MQYISSKYILLIILFFSTKVLSALSVDKMIVIANSSDDYVDIRVSNSDDFPVLVNVILTEKTDESEKEFDQLKFEDQPVYVDIDELIIDPLSSIKVRINNLSKMLGKTIFKDRIIGVSFIPQSYKDENSKKYSVNILTGFKVWYVLPSNKEGLSYDTDINIDNNEMVLINNSDTVIEFVIDSCEIESSNHCREPIIVLSKNKKKVTFPDELKNKEVMVYAKDFNQQYEKKFKVKLI